MKRFQNVLVVAGGKDGGIAAVTRAAQLAKRHGTTVTVIDVVDSLPPLLEIPGTEDEETYEHLVDRKKDAIGRLARRLKKQGIVAKCELLQGSPAEIIVQWVLGHRHDLLIKTADQPDGISQRLFGTIGQRLMRNCPCPVWIVKASDKHRYHRILAAIDPHPNSVDHDPLNERILDLAASLAEADQSEFHVVYVWPRAESSSLSGDPSVSIEVDQTIADSQEPLLSALISRFRQQERIDQVHLLKGHPADSISRLAEDLKIELLVMGSVCRVGVTGFVIGSTAERILDQVNCSVLTLKPPGFTVPFAKQLTTIA